MKACGHENVTVEGCDTCYVVKLKKRVDKLLAAEHKRLDRIRELESAARAVLIHYRLDGGDFVDAMNDLEKLLPEQGK